MKHQSALRALALAAVLCLGMAQAGMAAESGAGSAPAAGTPARGPATASAVNMAGTPIQVAIPAPSASAPAMKLGEKAKVIELPAPQKAGGMPLMEALAARHSERTFSPEEVSLQDVANLAWAVCGVNREDGRRTLPTAVNSQRIGLYLVMKDGVYRYNAKRNNLKQVLEGPQYLKMYENEAPLVLLHAANTADRYSAYHIGSMYQNAALYCAAAGLVNVPKWIESDKLKDVLPLPKNWAVFIIQPVGHPAPKK